MRYRVIAVVAAALALGVVAATATASTKHTATNTLTVWLMVDASNGWPSVVTAATNKFEADHPAWTVDVQYQTWGNHLTNLDAAIAGNTVPDVIEMGNTEMTKYMAAGAFEQIKDPGTFDNSTHWLAGLKKSVTYNGKLYGIPYYAGSRLVTYRTDLFKKAGYKKPPKSLGQFETQLAKVGKQNKKIKGFRPFYMAGTDWYSALSFVYDYGGAIAKQNANGNWIGTLDSKKSLAGLNAYKKFFLSYSPHSAATLNEANPAPYSVYASKPVGHAAAIFGPGWYSCCTGAYTKVTGQFIMPSHVKGQEMPGWLGGSDLAVPLQGDATAMAMGEAWIADYTSTTSEKALQAVGNIPNASNLLDNSLNDQAAKRSWFVPTAKHWVDVENANYLRTMLAQILTGNLTVKQAAEQASTNIAVTLNQP